MKANTEKKNQLTPAHLILFVVSLLAVILTAAPYVRVYMAERRAIAQYESGGMAGMRRGGPGGQGGFNPQQMAARRLEEMTQQLQLSTEQRSKIKTIQENFAPRTKAIFEDATLSREQRREKMRPIRAESDAQIRQILTPEQQTKYDQMQAQRRGRFGGGMGENRQGGQRGQGNPRNPGRAGANAAVPTNPAPPASLP